MAAIGTEPTVVAQNGLSVDAMIGVRRPAVLHQGNMDIFSH
jgi:hypothetical protein